MRCSSCFSFLLLFFFVINLSSVISDQYTWLKCKNDSKYAEGSTYSANLNRVKSDLFSNTSLSSGFNTSSFGETPNKVYGLLQCFGNISADKCSECAHQANSYVMEHCANAIGGLVLKDFCILRYDNTSFFSSLDITVYAKLQSPSSVVLKYVDEFKAKTSSLLSNLSNLAYNPANGLLAIGSANYSTTEFVYGFVQCWRDLSINDCEKCLSTARTTVEDCCSAKQGGRALLGSCVVRFETNIIFDTPDETSPYSTPTTSAPPVAAQFQSKKKHSKVPIISGVVGGFILLLVICTIAMRKRVRSLIFGRPVTRERHGHSAYSGLLADDHHIIMSLESLAEATQNFHEHNKLGEGGFGPVYWGTTREGKEIAVKKLSARSTQGKREFINEVQLMANVQHRNLVKLLGCCAEGDEMLLVYEYLPNKSLDTFLFHPEPEKRKLLDWEKRYHIIIGIVHGLRYLHEDSQLKIIHRDIKANNILLDDKLNPKIADFGLARLFPEDETQIQTRVAGTCGYMAPEYAHRGQLSVKADVYSFGVLLLEIVCGRKNTDLSLCQDKQSLLEWAWRSYREGDVISLVESGVRESCREDQVIRCIHVGLLCVQADATVRPTMSTVILMISSNAMALPNPTKPAYFTGSDSNEGVGLERHETGTSIFNELQMNGSTSSTISWVPSVNETSVTHVGPR